ncbi:T9SS type A sorting domain-containing protein [candidate division KSB1 bacterium]|nr:T9SS type A sorting domain-containing protein [candidate division KSB1 bacterium]
MKKNILTVLFLVSISSIHAQDFQIKVACVGNSITEGFGRDNASSYPNQLDALLGDRYNVRNFGIGGRTLLKNGDYPYWNEEIFLLAQDYEPDIVVILLGTNDSKPQNWAYKDEFYFDYADLVDVFRNLASEPEIFVGFPPPVFQDAYGINDAIVHNEIIPLIDSVRTTLHTFYINFYDNMTGMGDLFPDGIHPDAIGYGEMARIAAEAILHRPSGVITYFYATLEVLEEDESAILYWETSDSSVVTLDHQVVAAKDSLRVSPTVTTEYVLIASGEFNDTSMVKISFLPSGLIKSFSAQPSILEKDASDSAVIHWQTTKNSQVKFDGSAVYANDSLVVKPNETSVYTLIANGTVADTSYLTLRVLPPDQINRSQLAASYSASSVAIRSLIASAFDEDTTTFWLSNGHNAEWLMVDLGRELYMNRIKIIWGTVHATSYRIEAMDEQNKMAVFTTTAAGVGGIEDISGEAVKCRWVRILCLKSSSSTQGYEIKELEIYGSSNVGSGIFVEMDAALPSDFKLMQNYPNPFNPRTVINYSLPVASKIDLSIYNSLGQKVTTLVSQDQASGNYRVEWDAHGQVSGIYFCRLKTDKGFVGIKKIMLVK